MSAYCYPCAALSGLTGSNVHCGSPLVMSHYWNKPDKTAEAIIEVEGLGAGWFRSGDIAELDAENVRTVTQSLALSLCLPITASPSCHLIFSLDTVSVNRLFATLLCTALSFFSHQLMLAICINNAL